MRIHQVSHVGALLFALILPTALAGQAPVPDDLVRVTIRDTTGGHSVFGHLTSVARDTLALRIVDGDFVVRIDRSTVMRIERRADVSARSAVVSGCLVVGGILGLAGSQVHDPDSPGIEKYLAVLGSIFGCAVGALGGVVISSLREHYTWEEITV